MDAKFHPALKAISTGDLERFKELIEADPSLAISRSKWLSTSWPTTPIAA